MSSTTNSGTKGASKVSIDHQVKRSFVDYNELSKNHDY